jgi:hypothetical protein
MKTSKEKLIPDRYISTKGSYIENIDGQDFLIANDVMYTFYRRTRGSSQLFSWLSGTTSGSWGASAPSAGLVRVPHFSPIALSATSRQQNS